MSVEAEPQQQISEDSRILRRPGSVKKGGKPSTKTVNWSLQQEHWGKYIYIKKNQIAKFILPITIRFFFKFVLFYLQFVSGKRPCLRVSGLAVSRKQPKNWPSIVKKGLFTVHCQKCRLRLTVKVWKVSRYFKSHYFIWPSRDCVSWKIYNKAEKTSSYVLKSTLSRLYNLILKNILKFHKWTRPRKPPKHNMTVDINSYRYLLIQIFTLINVWTKLPLNILNRQPSKTLKFNRQPSKLEKINRQPS